MATDKVIAQQVARILYLFTSDTNPERVEVVCTEWKRAFDWCDDDLLDEAVTVCVDTLTFLPKIAEVNAAAEAILRRRTEMAAYEERRREQEQRDALPQFMGGPSQEERQAFLERLRTRLEKEQTELREVSRDKGQTDPRKP